MTRPTSAVLLPTLLSLLCLTGASACATLRGDVAAGAAALLDCEAASASLPASTLSDATILAGAALANAIDSSGVVDETKLRADLAQIESQLGQCAATAAAVALVGRGTSTPPTTPTPTGAMQSRMAAATADVQLSLAALTRVRTKLGWPRMRIVDGREI